LRRMAASRLTPTGLAVLVLPRRSRNHLGQAPSHIRAYDGGPQRSRDSGELHSAAERHRRLRLARLAPKGRSARRGGVCRPSDLALVDPQVAARVSHERRPEDLLSVRLSHRALPSRQMASGHCQAAEKANPWTASAGFPRPVTGVGILAPRLAAPAGRNEDGQFEGGITSVSPSRFCESVVPPDDGPQRDRNYGGARNTNRE